MTAITVEGLSKQYRLGPQERYGALRDSLARWSSAPFRRTAGTAAERIWALREVSFEAAAGEIVGIVGRNGSGKSTLLKVLSRITEPTSGRAVVRGRVSSLLEVGTGFHPELTGRENVFVNGAILGMTRREIASRFDEIVAFADVERFLDTPVKHYSSGMQMRLAFAVAAHLESAILFVDEVLAVGDAAFQQKCLGKMQDVHRSGRTVLLVSHQMNQLRRLCHRAIWLNQGEVRRAGPAAEVIGAYEASFRERGDTAARTAASDTRAATFVSWRVNGCDADREQVVRDTGAVEVTFVLDVRRHTPRLRHGIALLSATGQNLWGTAVTDLDLPAGVHHLRHRLPSLPLQPGAYTWQVSAYTTDGLIDLWDSPTPMILEVPPMTHYRDEYAGVLNMRTEFSVAAC